MARFSGFFSELYLSARLFRVGPCRGPTVTFWRGKSIISRIAAMTGSSCSLSPKTVPNTGAVSGKQSWAWPGYAELMGWRRRNRLLDLDKLLWLVRCSDAAEFRKQFTVALEEAMINDKPNGPKHVEAIEQQIRGRQEMRIEQEGGSWVLRRNMERFLKPKSTP
jgi:hypothetical protein